MDINPYSGISGITTSSAANSAEDRTELGQDEFLELMTTQLTNQDPFEPMDNGEFLSQIAQFGTVNGVNELLDSFENLAASLQSSQALQASNLIGRHVLVDSDLGYLPQDGFLYGAAELDGSAENVIVNIHDTTGALVGQVDLGRQSSGQVQFGWDGTMLDGLKAPAGRYRISIEATNGDSSDSLAPQLLAQVVSLTLAGPGQEMQVELSNLGQVDFSQVNQIL